MWLLHNTKLYNLEGPFGKQLPDVSGTGKTDPSQVVGSTAQIYPDLGSFLCSYSFTYKCIQSSWGCDD